MLVHGEHSHKISSLQSQAKAHGLVVEVYAGIKVRCCSVEHNDAEQGMQQLGEQEQVIQSRSATSPVKV